VSLKGALANGLLMALSVLATLAVAELFLRYGMNPERLVPNAPETPRLNERRNALRFYAKQRQRTSFGGHDRWLGWDAGDRGTRVRGRASIPPLQRGDLRVIALGDSFTWGNEVAADENFAYLLDAADNGLQVLNMGVPGYGIDQMVLKYERHGAALEPDLIILGIYVSDYERSTVAFTAAAKPLFQLVNDQLLLTNSPVPAPAVALEQVARSLNGQLFLREFIATRLPAARQGVAAFFDASDLLIEGMLHRLRRELGERQALLVLHIPRGESFLEPDPFHQEMSIRLLSLYRKLGLWSLNVDAVLTELADRSEIPGRFYRVRESGSVGHLNPEGHRVVAAAIEAEIAAQRVQAQASAQPLAFTRQTSMIPAAR
jgi:hypothetical protein